MSMPPRPLPTDGGDVEGVHALVTSLTGHIKRDSWLLATNLSASERLNLEKRVARHTKARDHWGKILQEAGYE
jgi:hypothetical protein